MPLRDLTSNTKIVTLGKSPATSGRHWPTPLCKLIIDTNVVALGISLVITSRPNSIINERKQRLSKKDADGRKYINTTN